MNAALENIFDDAGNRLRGILRCKIGDYHEMTNYKVMTHEL